MRHARGHRLTGQSIAVIGVFLAAVFIIMGLAIDGGILYAQRRLMQNTADAACLAAANRLSLAQTASAAQTAAQQSVAQNFAASAPGTLDYGNDPANLYTPTGGSGAALTRGIEISGAEVRVALESPARSTFLQLIGVARYSVAARARCGSASGGGLLPYAVSRWRGYKANGDQVSGAPTTDQTLPQTYTQGNQNPTLIVRDLLARQAGNADQVTGNWPGWGGTDYPGNPLTGTGLYSSPANPASAGSQGRETVINGNGAGANVSTNSSFDGTIMLDYRQVTFPQPLVYNGLPTNPSLQQAKDSASGWILNGYPGPDVVPGQQIGIYSGISAGQFVAPFSLRYSVGMTVTALVYNGSVYDGTDMVAQFPSAADATRTWAPTGISATGLVTCTIPTGFVRDTPSAGSRTRTAPATFRVTLTPQNLTRVKLRAFLSDNPANWGNLQGQWGSGGWSNLQIENNGPEISIDPAASASARTISFSVRASAVTTCYDPSTTPASPVDLPIRRDGAQTIYLEFQDVNTSKRAAVYARLTAGSLASTDFYAQVPGQLSYTGYTPGSSFTAPFTLESDSGSSFYVDGSRVSLGAISWFAPGDLNTPIGTGATLNGVTVTPGTSGNGANKQNELAVSVASSATTGREYYIRLPITYTQGGSSTHFLWYYVQVRPNINNSNSMARFVYALGYANFVITGVESNAVRARAISGLLRPEQVVAGLAPRLLTWQ